MDQEIRILYPSMAPVFFLRLKVQLCDIINIYEYFIRCGAAKFIIGQTAFASFNTYFQHCLGPTVTERRCSPKEQTVCQIFFFYFY